MGLSGLSGKVVEFIRVSDPDAFVSDVRFDAGGGDLLTGQHGAPPGEDSHPLETDHVLAVPLDGEGRWIVLGYIDPSNEPQASEGEKRLYARDANGNIVGVLWLKNSGRAELTGDNVHLGDAPAPAKISRDDHVQSELTRLQNELIALKVWLDEHVHSASGAGVPATLSPIPGSPGQTACDRVYGK